MMHLSTHISVFVEYVVRGIIYAANQSERIRVCHCPDVQCFSQKVAPITDGNHGMNTILSECSK